MCGFSEFNWKKKLLYFIRLKDLALSTGRVARLTFRLLGVYRVPIGLCGSCRWPHLFENRATIQLKLLCLQRHCYYGFPSCFDRGKVASQKFLKNVFAATGLWKSRLVRLPGLHILLPFLYRKIFFFIYNYN